jgi:hypothetical protein
MDDFLYSEPGLTTLAGGAAAAVPEAATPMFVAGGLLAVAGMYRRKRT